MHIYALILIFMSAPLAAQTADNKTAPSAPMTAVSAAKTTSAVSGATTAPSVPKKKRRRKKKIIAPPPVVAPLTAAPTEQAVAASTEPAIAPALEPSQAQEPWMVCETAVSGNINIKGKAILKQASAKAGNFYDKESINKDVEAVTAMSSFDQVSVDVTPVEGKYREEDGKKNLCHKVTYLVKEKPKITDIKIEGSKKLSKSAVEDAMTLKEKDPFDEAKLKDDMDKIKAKYLEKGYTAAEADYKFEADKKPNTVKITVKVAEGKKSVIKQVDISGVSELPVKKLTKKLKNRPGKTYRSEEISKDPGYMETYARNKGYADFRIENSSVSFSPDKSEVYISYAVTEGKKSKFGATTFSGNTIITEAEMRPSIDYRQGKQFKQEKLDDSIRNIQEQFADKGHMQAVVVPEKTQNPQSGELDINFSVTENAAYYVSHIDVSGNKSTKPYVFRREIVLKEGELLRSSRIRKSQERIMNLGFVNDVVPDFIPTEDPNKYDVVFDVNEGNAGLFTATAAVSTVDGLVGQLSLNHLNMFGRAQKVGFSWSFGKRVLDYQLSWTTPWLAGKPMSFGADLFNTRRLKPFSYSSTAYHEKRLGGRLRLGPRFEEDKYQLSFAYALENVEITNVETELKDMIPEGKNITSSLLAGVAVDTRDSFIDPTRGSRHSLSFELTGGPLQGDLDYYKTFFSSSYS
ncbi:MAG: outer membrane protein assembly factor BamA, partial [Elusimicrobia bacterium]|nr:outer membrane protein assembly factor BamA [Elusimicrobiota bacterium]